jgi:hypothetical protein
MTSDVLEIADLVSIVVAYPPDDVRLVGLELCQFILRVGSEIHDTLASRPRPSRATVLVLVCRRCWIFAMDSPQPLISVLPPLRVDPALV